MKCIRGGARGRRGGRNHPHPTRKNVIFRGKQLRRKNFGPAGLLFGCAALRAAQPRAACYSSEKIDFEILGFGCLRSTQLVALRLLAPVSSLNSSYSKNSETFKLIPFARSHLSTRSLHTKNKHAEGKIDREIHFWGFSCSGTLQ